MSGNPSTKAGRAVALAIGVLAVALINAVKWLILDERPAQQAGLILIQFFLITPPFGLLALAGVNKVVPWFVGLSLTAMLWSYEIYDDSLDRGVNFLLGPLLLLSPIAIAIACFAANEGVRERT
jgi:hypothetical protein